MTRSDDEQVEELIRGIRTRFVTRSDLSYDFQSGLADVYSRAGLPFARVPARSPRPGPPPRSAAVALACEQLGDFCALLDSVWLSGAQPEPPGSQIQRAGEVLARLAGRLSTGSGSAASASAALTGAADLLGLADVLLRAHGGRSVDDLLAAGAGSLTSHAAVLDRLEHAINAALASSQPPGRGARASVRRRFPGTSRRRPAGGQ